MKAGARTLQLLLATALLVVGVAGAGAATPTAAPPTAATPSAAGLYNAGNSFARQGDVPMAILNYERARVLAPNDVDIKANLEHIRAGAGLPTQTGSWLENHARLGNPNVLYWSGVVGIALLGTSVLVLSFSERRRLAGLIAAVIAAPLCVAAIVDCIATAPVLHEAVILRASAVRVSPVPGGDTLFTLPAGQVVSVTDDYQDFKLIKTDAGRLGWVAAADVAPVT